ncbi:MAG TPA: hypothetical protein VJL80_06395 [Aeromicrobium sp.]|nr:hypothetical protein [Aeromicrobium sp.]HKY57648.1 hypothetical protein [Aeromicrobium sp.]
MLKDIIPAEWRRFVYAAYFLAATIAGALAVGGVDTGKFPDVIAYLGIAVGAVAASNTANQAVVFKDPAGEEVLRAEPEEGAVNVVEALLVVFLVVVILAVLGYLR